MTNFSNENWNQILAKKDWSLLEECESVNQMAEVFDEIIQEALDEIAPVKSFTVKSQYKFGLSTEAKTLMKKRDSARLSISKAGGNEKATLLKKYLKTRSNQVSC